MTRREWRHLNETLMAEAQQAESEQRWAAAAACWVALADLREAHQSFFRDWMEGREVSLGQGDMTIRECDHQALIPIYILEGLAADEAESRGGDAEFGLREVVETVPGSEETAPTCDEVKEEFQRVG